MTAEPLSELAARLAPDHDVTDTRVDEYYAAMTHSLHEAIHAEFWNVATIEGWDAAVRRLLEWGGRGVWTITDGRYLQCLPPLSDVSVRWKHAGATAFLG